MKENLDLLRMRLLTPGTTYGWEDPAYESEEDFLGDNQYVYYSVYARAIEDTTGVPLHKAVTLTREETAELFRLLQAPTSENHHWAKWLARRLRVSLASDDAGLDAG